MTAVTSPPRLNLRGLWPWVLPFCITGIQWLTSENRVTAVQTLLAGILLLLSSYSYHRWRARTNSVAPLFSLIAAAHWAGFTALLFWWKVPADPIYDIPLREDTITAVLAMAVLGVASLGLGMQIPFRPVNSRLLPDLRIQPRTWHYLYVMLAAGTVFGMRDEFALSLGTGARQIMEALRSTVPNAVFAILLQRYFRGESTRADRVAIFGYTGVRVVAGMASGWLGHLLGLGLTSCAAYGSVHRRLPARFILPLIPAFLFFQAGKEAFRQTYWYGGHTGSVTDKVFFWVDRSAEAWSAALRDGSKKDEKFLISSSLSRVSILDQAGNVYQMTPKVVPYQNGKTYTYLLITLVPRFIWPDKPSVNEANRFYQLAYGLNTAEELDRVSISVGFLMESFINFGWPGVVLVMLAIGFILGLVDRALYRDTSGLLFNGIAIAILINFTVIESQAAQYLAGLLQKIAVTVVVLAPVVRMRKPRPPQWSKVAAAA